MASQITIDALSGSSVAPIGTEVRPGDGYLEIQSTVLISGSYGPNDTTNHPGSGVPDGPGRLLAHVISGSLTRNLKGESFLKGRRKRYYCYFF